MNYNISSEQLENPFLKDLLKDLTNFFTEKGMDFYVIGATARDLVLCNFYDLAPERKTADLDIAIAISDWGQFQLLEKDLPLLADFEKSKEQKQRFIYKGIYMIDVVPFGGVTKEDGNIYWPPDETIAMSVCGFSEMAKNAIRVKIDNDFDVNIASLPGLFMLKLMAWQDRHFTSEKDAYDIAYLLSNYLTINQERAVEDHYDDLYDNNDFDLFIAGGQLMAKDVKLLLQDNEQTLYQLSKILLQEIKLEEESQLINQLIESNSSLKYEQVVTCLQSILKEWEK